ncbi:Lariat debranching enzyme, C-terminal domain [Musa troglodytarum]|uniref:Lariat debranching enzyme, C-terminal domain n=1 Tax=Musa troglodytarum TaxID=320322 RepID=A0A9E7HUS2_9LILI|nr:Lariat debranching enzyme, C-terminal domain [Musa troglodytarum]
MKALPNATLLSVDLCLSLVCLFAFPLTAVGGCLHGELDEVYASIRHVEKVEDTKIDLLIRCGDFQAVRNENDLKSLSCAHQNIGIKKSTLGRLLAAELLNQHKPHYWFSGYLHCNFTAAIQHKKDGSITKFVALDKCVPGRKFLQVEIPCLLLL